MMKRTLRILVFVAAAFLLADIAASLYMLHLVLDNVPQDDESRRTWHGLSPRLAFTQAWLDSVMSPGVLQDTFIVTERGDRLHAYYLSAREATPHTALLVHGHKGQALGMMAIGYMYHHDFGYNLLLPDLYAHGKSDGTRIRMGWKDRMDVMRWAEVANDVFGGNTEMTIHGISMGAATTMMLAGEDTPDYIKAFVEDCGYTSVWDECRSELKKRYGLPPFPVLHTASLLCRLTDGWSFRQASSLRQVAKSIKPMLFIHGDADTYVPTWMVYPLYEAKNGMKDLWLVPEATHAVSYDMYPQEYTERVRAFLAKVCSSASGE